MEAYCRPASPDQALDLTSRSSRADPVQTPLTSLTDHPVSPPAGFTFRQIEPHTYSTVCGRQHDVQMVTSPVMTSSEKTGITSPECPSMLSPATSQITSPGYQKMTSGGYAAVTSTEQSVFKSHGSSTRQQTTDSTSMTSPGQTVIRTSPDRPALTSPGRPAMTSPNYSGESPPSSPSLAKSVVLPFLQTQVSK